MPRLLTKALFKGASAAEKKLQKLAGKSRAYQASKAPARAARATRFKKAEMIAGAKLDSAIKSGVRGIANRSIVRNYVKPFIRK